MRQLVSEKENSEFKPVKLWLKIDLVSYPIRAEGLVNMIKQQEEEEEEEENEIKEIKYKIVEKISRMNE